MTRVVVKGTIPIGPMTGTITYFVIDESSRAVVGQLVLPNASDPPRGVNVLLQLPPSPGPFAIGVFDAKGQFAPASGLIVNREMGS